MRLFTYDRVVEPMEVGNMKIRKDLYDCNRWAWCCTGFGVGMVLATFASIKLVLILSGLLLIAIGVRILVL